MTEAVVDRAVSSGDGDVSRETLGEIWLRLNRRERSVLDAIAAGEYVPLARYARLAWAIVEPGTTYVHNWHIDAIAEHLEAAARLWIRNLIINIPPRCMKSRMVSVFFPTWVWTWAPWLRFLFASYAEDRSLADAVDSRTILQSSWYRMLWGHRVQLAGDQNMKSRYQNTARGHRVSVGVGGRGLGEGGDILVIDDPHKTQGVESEKQRLATLSWYDKTFSTRGNDPKTVAKIIIMQRLHTQDLIGHLAELEETGGEKWERLVLPEEFDPGRRCTTALGFSDPRDKAGELLWTPRRDREYIDQLKVTLGPYGAAGQLAQLPSPLEGGIFKKRWWRFWQRPGQALPAIPVELEDGEVFLCPVVELPTKWTAQAQSWDCSFKKVKDSSFVVGQVWGRRGADRYLLAQVRDRKDIVDTIAAVERVSKRWPRARGKYVEDKANGTAVIRLLNRKISGLIPYSPQGDKVSRAMAAVPEVAAGNVYLPHPRNAPWVLQFIERFANFPNGPDDEIDAFSQLMDVWSTPGWTRGMADG